MIQNIIKILRKISLMLLILHLSFLNQIENVEKEEDKEDDDDDGLCFGIDLGTTFSSIAINDHSKREIILNRHGNSITPSLVAFKSNGEVLVGEEAKQVEKEENLVRTIKRIIGRTYDDPRVQQEKQIVKHKIVEDPKSKMASVEIDGKILSAEEISSKILENQIESAYRYLKNSSNKNKKNVKGAVITVPAYFKSNERNATMQAAKLAGIKLLKIVSEPVSAAIANQDENLVGNTVVVDIGGGTSDISVLHIEDGIYDSQSTTGDSHLGGFDFDQLILDILRENHGNAFEDLLANKEARFDAFKFAEMLKIQLSSKQLVDYVLPIATENSESTSGSISRSRFNEKLKPYLNKIGDLIEEALNVITMDSKDVQNFLLVGGSSRIPALSQMIERRFKKKAILSDQPDHAIAIGAAIVAAQQCHHSDAETILISHVPFGLGVKAMQGSETMTVFIIERNSAVPVKKTKTFSTAYDNQSGVTVEILQGFSLDVSENTKIGEVHYDNLPKARAGKVEVEVEFMISENQVVTANVKGKYDNAETRSQEISLVATSLTEEEIEKHKVAADRRRFVMEAVLEIENKLSQSFYFIESEISKSKMESSHLAFMKDIKEKWQKMKEEVYSNKEISDQEIDEFKKESAKLYEEAEPVIQKVLEIGNKAVNDYDSKQVQEGQDEFSKNQNANTHQSSASNSADL